MFHRLVSLIMFLSHGVETDASGEENEFYEHYFVKCIAGMFISGSIINFIWCLSDAISREYVFIIFLLTCVRPISSQMENKYTQWKQLKIFSRLR